MFLDLDGIINEIYVYEIKDLWYCRVHGRAMVRKKTDAGSVRDGLQPGGTDHWSGVVQGPKDNVDLKYHFLHQT